jgi:competence protein ComEA
MSSRLFADVLAHLRSRPLLAGLAALPFMALITVLAVLAFVPPAAPPTPAPATAPAPAANALPPISGLLVEVNGAVAHPGMYRVAKGERVSAAITAAGGLAPDADTTHLPNLAARLKDGQQVVVPSLGVSVRTSTRTSTPPRVTKISLNTATADQLAAIPGFSTELAVAAIQYRTQYGGFVSARELVDVLNMSESDYLLASPYLTVAT